LTNQKNMIYYNNEKIRKMVENIKEFCDCPYLDTYYFRLHLCLLQPS